MPKITDSWKALERYAAKILGGSRVSRGADFGKSLPDVKHDYFAIEVKYRTNAFKNIYDYLEQAMQYSKDKVPLVVIRRRGKKALAVIELESLGELYENYVCNKRASRQSE